jgi:hypothetical protein
LINPNEYFPENEKILTFAETKKLQNKAAKSEQVFKKQVQAPHRLFQNCNLPTAN